MKGLRDIQISSESLIYQQHSKLLENGSLNRFGTLSRLDASCVAPSSQRSFHRVARGVQMLLEERHGCRYSKHILKPAGTKSFQFILIH